MLGQRNLYSSCCIVVPALKYTRRPENVWGGEALDGADD
jgi:hypothetical protein